jgi:di/tricarboxylate transporter
MSLSQIEILMVLLATVLLFLWGRWRHDLVALAALMACVLLGLVPAEKAFAGFGHPAVITVACVLILSRGLQDTGAVDRLTRWLLPKGMGLITGIAAIAALGALLSAFMNNVGAMALLLPVALQLSNRFDMAPSRILMPLAFGTILGGMTTLIGTPPNLIVAGFRETTGSAVSACSISRQSAALSHSAAWHSSHSSAGALCRRGRRAAWVISIPGNTLPRHAFVRTAAR